MQKKVVEDGLQSWGRGDGGLIRFNGALLSLALIAFLLTACTFPETNVVPTAAHPPPATPSLALSAAPTGVEACFTEPDATAALQFAQTRIAALVPGAQVNWYDGFSCAELGAGWTIGHANPTSQVSVVDGVLTIRAQKVEQLWESVGRSAGSLLTDQGMLVLFQFEAGTTAPLFISVGDWQTQNYLRAGLTINNDVEHVWQIWEGLAFLSHPLTANVLRPDTPFYLLIRLSNDGQVTMQLWEQDNLKNQAVYQDRMPGLWVGRGWASVFQLQEGAIKLDEYFEFSLRNP